MKKSTQNQFVCDRDSHSLAKSVIVFVIGVACGIVTLGMAQHYDRQSAKPALVLKNKCVECHRPEPVISSYKQYRKFHQKPTAEDRRLAQEMADNEYIVSQFIKEAK